MILFFFQDLNGLDNFVLNEILFRFGGEGGERGVLYDRETN